MRLLLTMRTAGAARPACLAGPCSSPGTALSAGTFSSSTGVGPAAGSVSREVTVGGVGSGAFDSAGLAASSSGATAAGTPGTSGTLTDGEPDLYGALATT